MQPERRVKLALALIWFAPSLWAVNYIVGRMAPGVIDARSLALGRWMIACMVFSVVARARASAARLAPAFRAGRPGHGAGRGPDSGRGRLLGAWLVLNEPLGAHHLVGTGLILPGVLLVARAK